MTVCKMLSWVISSLHVCGGVTKIGKARQLKWRSMESKKS